jgi:hypothetical protein
MRITLRTSKGTRPGTVLRAPVRVTTSTRETNLADNQAQARTTVDAANAQQGQQGRPPSKGRPSAKPKKERPSSSRDD